MQESRNDPKIKQKYLDATHHAAAYYAASAAHAAAYDAAFYRCADGIFKTLK